MAGPQAPQVRGDHAAGVVRLVEDLVADHLDRQALAGAAEPFLTRRLLVPQVARRPGAPAGQRPSAGPPRRATWRSAGPGPPYGRPGAVRTRRMARSSGCRARNQRGCPPAAPATAAASSDAHARVTGVAGTAAGTPPPGPGTGPRGSAPPAPRCNPRPGAGAAARRSTPPGQRRPRARSPRQRCSRRRSGRRWWRRRATRRGPGRGRTWPLSRTGQG